MEGDWSLSSSRQWWTVMPEVCRRAHLGEEWKCFFGNNIYPTLKSESSEYPPRTPPSS